MQHLDIYNVVITNKRIHLAYITYCYYIITNNDLNELINNNLTHLTNNASLYFTKNVTFPRYKLENTSLKRVIWPTNADYIIIPDKYEYLGCHKDCVIFLDTDRSRDECGLYLLSKNQIPKGVDITTCSTFEDIFSGDNALKESLVDCKIIDVGNVYLANNEKMAYDLHLICNIVNKNKYVKLSELNSFVSNVLDDLTLQDCLSIYDLLKSESNQSLGLKTLASFNVVKYQNSIKFLISLVDNLKFTNVTTKHLKNSLSNITEFFSMFLNPKQDSPDFKLFIQLYEYFIQKRTNCSNFIIDL